MIETKKTVTIMKEQDLRIGNVVLFNGVESTMTGHNFFGFGRTFKDGVTALEYFNIKPIPLTEEWLLKFGFNDLQDNSYEFWKSSIWCLLFENGKYEVYYGSMCLGLPILKSVHQLQNLYHALTGEELIIKKPS